MNSGRNRQSGHTMAKWGRRGGVTAACAASSLMDVQIGRCHIYRCLQWRRQVSAKKFKTSCRVVSNLKSSAKSPLWSEKRVGKGAPKMSKSVKLAVLPSQVRHSAPIKVKFSREKHIPIMQSYLPNYPLSVNSVSGSPKNSKFRMRGYLAGFATTTRHCL